MLFVFQRLETEDDEEEGEEEEEEEAEEVRGGEERRLLLRACASAGLSLCGHGLLEHVPSHLPYVELRRACRQMKQMGKDVHPTSLATHASFCTMMQSADEPCFAAGAGGG